MNDEKLDEISKKLDTLIAIMEKIEVVIGHLDRAIDILPTSSGVGGWVLKTAVRKPYD